MNDNTDKAPRARKSYEERKEQLRLQLAKLEAVAAKQRLQEALDSGECADPERAAAVNKDLRYLTAAARTIVRYQLAAQSDVDRVIEALQKALLSAVEGTPE